MPARHVRTCRHTASAFWWRGSHRRRRHDRDAAAHRRGQDAARRSRISGAGRFHQGARANDGRGRRLWLAFAIRERGAVGQPDTHSVIHPVAERLRRHHTIWAALRAPPRGHSKYRPGAPSPGAARLGRPADEVLVGRPKALSDRVAHLFHGVLRYNRQRNHEGAGANRAAHAMAWCRLPNGPAYHCPLC